MFLQNGLPRCVNPNLQLIWLIDLRAIKNDLKLCLAWKMSHHIVCEVRGDRSSYEVRLKIRVTLVLGQSRLIFIGGGQVKVLEGGKTCFPFLANQGGSPVHGYGMGTIQLRLTSFQQATICKSHPYYLFGTQESFRVFHIHIELQLFTSLEQVQSSRNHLLNWWFFLCWQRKWVFFLF